MLGWVLEWEKGLVLELGLALGLELGLVLVLELELGLGLVLELGLVLVLEKDLGLALESALARVSGKGLESASAPGKSAQGWVSDLVRRVRASESDQACGKRSSLSWDFASRNRDRIFTAGSPDLLRISLAHRDRASTSKLRPNTTIRSMYLQTSRLPVMP